MNNLAARIAKLRAMLADPRQPGGYGSVPALQQAIASLEAGDEAGADMALSTFQMDAQRSSDFTAPHSGGSGAQRFSALRGL